MIGILALQGNIEEHKKILDRLNVRSKFVRLPSDFEGIDALIIPGGESTAMMRLIEKYKIDKMIKTAGLPIFGTCAGAIILAKKVIGLDRSLNLLDIEIKRNDYGRQIDSFEQTVYVKNLGKAKGVFIRAPIIQKTGYNVKVLAKLNNKPILVEENAILASTFHPEQANEIKIHKYFIDKINSMT